MAASLGLTVARATLAAALALPCAVDCQKPASRPDSRPDSRPEVVTRWTDVGWPGRPELLSDWSGHLEVTRAAGNYRWHSRDPRLDDNGDGDFWRVRAELGERDGFGMGLAFEWVETERELFAGTPEAGSRARSGEGFLYARFDMQQESGGVVLRLGPFVHGAEVESPSRERSTGIIGAKVEIEPELSLHAGKLLQVSLFAAGSLGVGANWHDHDHDEPGVEDRRSHDYHVRMGLKLGAEAGVRGRIGILSAGIGVLWRGTWIDHAQPTLADQEDSFGHAEDSFTGLTVTAGLRF